MAYTKLVDPERMESFSLSERAFRPGDRRSEPVYVYDERIKLALNVALAAGRPLLVAGEAGTGKSSLAYHLAAGLKWRLYTHTVSSRTQARDLQWTYDAVRRLSDAQAHQLRPTSEYVQPGVLWWAFDRGSATYRGLGAEECARREIAAAADLCVAGERDPAVVLVDEIDKADPDVPNDLLEPLATYRFRCEETGTLIEAKQVPLVIITTNEERDLPRAFLRRCVSLRLQPPDQKKLLRIALTHFPDGDEALHRVLADWFLELREKRMKDRTRPPSTAEYLDTVGACRGLGITDPASLEAHRTLIEELTLSKPQAADSPR
jgi:MoxR-like ATPase